MNTQQKWTIENLLRKLETNTRHRSKPFTEGHCDWKLAVCRRGKDKKYLAIYLCVADPSSLPPGWSISADFTLTVVNQSSREKSKAKGIKHTFRKDSGSSSFLRLEVLEGKRKGFIRDDKCIVEVEFKVVRGAGLIDFKDLAGIEEPFRPLLKEVFKLYPSMLDFTKKRIPQSRVTAYNDLGRILKLLKEKKWKDMNDGRSRKKLQDVWEKHRNSGLDLLWLKLIISLL